MSVKLSKGFVLTLVLVLSSVVLAVGPQTAKADAAISSYSVSCTSISARGTSNQPYVALRAYIGNTTNIDGLAIGGAPKIFDAWFDGSPTFAVSGGQYSFSVSFSVPQGSPISFRVFGATDSDGHHWDGSPVFQSVAVASCNQSFQGPPIPAGFVMKTVTCTVPAVQSPGGDVVPGINALVPGAHWYMSPTPVKDAKGKLWTEVFLAGWNNAFIPAECATW